MALEDAAFTFNTFLSNFQSREINDSQCSLLTLHGQVGFIDDNKAKG